MDLYQVCLNDGPGVRNGFVAGGIGLKNEIHLNRNYARGQRERRNPFRPANVTFFTSESDKNVALIIRKVRYLSLPITHVSSAQV